MISKITGQNVKLIPIDNQPEGELAEKIYYECGFCGKTTGLWSETRRICEKLSGDAFYCVSCLRNGFNNNNNSHILIMSFRGIIGYYYYGLYRSDRKIWVSEIEDNIKSHVKAGLQNPVFHYDPESLLWFVDFSKVGRGRKQIKIREVMKTISSILSCFNLLDHLPQASLHRLYEKYEDAISKFYTQRFRPNGKRELIPTLSGCGVYEHGKKFNMDDTRNFLPEKLIMRG